MSKGESVRRFGDFQRILSVDFGFGDRPRTSASSLPSRQTQTPLPLLLLHQLLLLFSLLVEFLLMSLFLLLLLLLFSVKVDIG